MSGSVDEPALRAKLLSGARWSVTIRLAGQAYSWLVTLFMIRLLTPADYGLNSMLEAPIELLTLFSAIGIDSALVRFGRKDERQLASAFGFLLLLNGAIFTGLLIGAPWIAAYFGEPSLEPLVQVSAVVFLLSPLRTIPNALLDMDLDFKLKAQVELQATVLSTLVGLGLAYHGAGVWALVGVVVLNAVLRAGLLACYRPWFVRPRLQFDQIRPLVGYGATLLASSFLIVASGKIYSVVGGPALGAEMLGLFAVAAGLSYLPISKTMPIIQQTLFPAFAKLAGEPAMVRKYILNALELCTLVIVPVGIGMAAVADDMVAAFFGPRWALAAAPLAVLSLLTPLRLLNLLLHTPLNATGHARVVVGLSTVTLVVFVCGIGFVLEYGVMGLVTLAVASTSLTGVAALFVALRMFSIGGADLLRATGRPLLACAVMGLSVLALNAETRGLTPGLSLAAATVLGAAVYFAALALLMGDRLRQIRRTVMSR